jgi:hypothetical protein
MSELSANKKEEWWCRRTNWLAFHCWYPTSPVRVVKLPEKNETSFRTIGPRKIKEVQVVTDCNEP